VGAEKPPRFRFLNQDAESQKTGGFTTSAKIGLVPVLTDIPAKLAAFLAPLLV
jgi:hypothetical protein